MRFLAFVAVLFTGALLFHAAPHLPKIGDPHSPASSFVSPRYIEKAAEEIHTPNIVTAVLADYRSFDTLGETTVILTAGLGCFLILGALKRKPE
jgi:multicomponent Na+:H+ antiporter subunit B